MTMQEERTPGSMLEIYMHALANRTSDSFLDKVNLGVGNYTEPEFWQQIETFADGMFADAAMTPKLMERAKLQAQRAMVDAIYDNPDSKLLDHVDYEDPGGPSERPPREEYFEEHAEDIWENLGAGEKYTPAEHRAWLVKHCTNLDPDWTPPHWRMLKARHEASRSKQARLLDNLFGRPPEDAGRAMEDFQ